MPRGLVLRCGRLLLRLRLSATRLHIRLCDERVERAPRLRRERAARARPLHRPLMCERGVQRVDRALGLGEPLEHRSNLKHRLLV